MDVKLLLIISAIIYLIASIIMFLAISKISTAVISINKIINAFFERADTSLNKMRATQKQYTENTDKTTGLIESLGDVRKTIITIGNFRSQLLDLSNMISRIKIPTAVTQPAATPPINQVKENDKK